MDGESLKADAYGAGRGIPCMEIAVKGTLGRVEGEAHAFTALQEKFRSALKFLQGARADEAVVHKKYKRLYGPEFGVASKPIC
eukprot:750157-Amphidinium_carterae.1